MAKTPADCGKVLVKGKSVSLNKNFCTYFFFSKETFPVIVPNIGSFVSLRIRLAGTSWWWTANDWLLSKVSKIREEFRYYSFANALWLLVPKK